MGIMEIEKWSNSFSVGIQSIDEQHQKLFELINTFYSNIDNQSSDTSNIELVKGMKEYIQLHFSTEEKYMEQFDYPLLEEHVSEHSSFINQVAHFEENIANKRLILSYEITNFIKNWITNHIKKSDMKYSNYLVSCGVR